MNNSPVLKFFLINALAIRVFTASGQARLVLNGAHMVITNNATLVIANSNANAITRLNGSIISEGEGNKIQWMMGEAIGTYTLPWGNGTTYMPLTFTKSAGSGAGNFLLSTFPTLSQNNLKLPAGVTNLNRSGTDRSLYFIDRFWQMNAQGYTIKPSLTNVQFGYLDAEHAEPNMIVEIALGAVRWNNVTQNWDGYGPAGEADFNNNVVNVPTIESSELYSWWSLMGLIQVLPVRFLSFSALRQGNMAKLTWKTGIEVNVLDFEVQRSVNGSGFNSIGQIPAYGGSSTNAYFYTDASPAKGSNAYRIKETDKNGTFYYSEIRSIVMDKKPGGVEIYPNPVTGNSFTINATGIPAGTYTIQLNSMGGKLVASFSKALNGNYVTVRLDKSIAKGVYLLKLTSGENTFFTHLMMNGN